MKTIHQNVPAYLNASTYFYFVILEKDGSINYANPFFQKKFDYILSKNPVSFFMEGFSPCTENLKEKFNEWIIKKSPSQKIVQQILNKDGGYSFISWEMTLSNPDYDQNEMIQCIGVDITGHSKFEKGSKTTSTDHHKPLLADQMVMASEQFYRNLISNSLDGMLILNKEGIIQFVSPSVENILGFTRDDLMFKNGFSYIHPEDYQISIDSFNRELNEQPIL